MKLASLLPKACHLVESPWLVCPGNHLQTNFPCPPQVLHCVVNMGILHLPSYRRSKQSLEPPPGHTFAQVCPCMDEIFHPLHSLGVR